MKNKLGLTSRKPIRMKIVQKYFVLMMLTSFVALFIEPPTATAQNSRICLPNRIYGPSNDLALYARLGNDYVGYNIDRGIGNVRGFLHQINTGQTSQIVIGNVSLGVDEFHGDYVTVVGNDPDTPNYPDNFDVFLYQLSTGQVTRLTNTPIGEGASDIYGDYVTYVDEFDNRYLYQISTGVTLDITPTIPRDLGANPVIHADVVVWGQNFFGSTPSDYYYYQISTGENGIVGVGSTQANGIPPQVYGDTFVWQHYDLETENFDLMAFRVGSKQFIQITDDTVYDGEPYIEGDYIVWPRGTRENAEIFQYQISTGQMTQLTNGGGNKIIRAFEDDHIVFVEADFRLKMMRHSTGEIITINPSMTPFFSLATYESYFTNGGRLLYVPLGIQDLYLYDPNKPDICAPNLLINGSFENGMRGWTGKGRTNDRAVCTDLSKGLLYSYHQKCGFRFSPSANEASSIRQTVNLRQSGLKAGDRLTFGAWVWPVRTKPEGKISAVVRLKSGRVQRMGIPFPDSFGGFTLQKKTFTLKGAPSEITLSFSNAAKTKRGDLRLDRAFVFVEPPITELAASEGILPGGLRR